MSLSKLGAMVVAASHSIVAATISNPVIWADVPDPSVIRVGSTFYMSSTTMHLAPGVPIMESTDLVNWTITGYAYQTLADIEELRLTNGRNAYGRGSWASSIRHRDGVFHVLFASLTTGRTYLYRTRDIRNGPWSATVYNNYFHDPSLLLDDDGRNYIVHGGGDIRIIELTSDLSGVLAGGIDQILIRDASSVAGSSMNLRAEGSHIQKINGMYYVFNICWPSGGPRTQIVHRSPTLLGTWTGRIALQSQGVAQGSLVQAADNTWWGILFQDNGAVGRSPWLIPVTWSDGWPVFGGGNAPASLQMNVRPPIAGGGMVSSDDFSETRLPLVWQWNHNPDPSRWSLTARQGHLRITTGRVDTSIVMARNSLGQRSFGPRSSAVVAIDAAGLRDGDLAGLAAFSHRWGFVAVRRTGNAWAVVQTDFAGDRPATRDSVPISVSRVFLRIDMDFRNRTDRATFFWSLDSSRWNPVGSTLAMTYGLEHFMGYRFTLFNMATRTAGGHADFDWFHIGPSWDSPVRLQTQQSPLRSAWGDTLNLPGRLEAEHFDRGGQGVAWNDLTPGNQGAAFRQDDPDLDTAGGTTFLGWVEDGEWIEWTVRVLRPGPLHWIARVGSASDRGRMRLQSGTRTIAGPIDVPNTGNWTNFTEINGTTASLDAGVHTLRLAVDSAWFNLDRIDFTEQTPTSAFRIGKSSSWTPRTVGRTVWLDGMSGPWRLLTPGGEVVASGISEGNTSIVPPHRGLWIVDAGPAGVARVITP